MAEFGLHTQTFHDTVRFPTHRPVWSSSQCGPLKYLKNLLSCFHFIQLKFRCYSDVRKGPSPMSHVKREKNWHFTKATRKRIKLIKPIYYLHYYKHAENLRIALILKNDKFSSSWGWLAWFSTIPQTSKFRAFKSVENNACTPGVRLSPSTARSYTSTSLAVNGEKWAPAE